MTPTGLAYAQIRPHLQPGESVRWMGSADPQRLFGPQDVFLIPFSVVWLAFALFWTSNVVGAPATAVGPSAAFSLVGVVFCIIGVYFVAGRFVVKTIARRRTTYALTDRRALSVRGRNFRSSPVHGQPVSYRQSRTGSHLTATVGTQAGFQSTLQDLEATGWPSFGSSQASAVTFYDVRDVEGLRSALAEAKL